MYIKKNDKQKELQVDFLIFTYYYRLIKFKQKNEERKEVIYMNTMDQSYFFSSLNSRLTLLGLIPFFCKL